ncbi:MAG: tetratricopeptide repeat protein [Acidobacteria bacterium]|nr:tetratricopeptide repeat protein [Acidobacteriota bacterium]
MDQGTRLGIYEIGELLGEGGMGSVYRARDTKLGRDVAIKVLLRNLASDPKLLARFEREAKVLASINHPNIATIYGFEDVDGTPYLVLEYLEGETLAQALQRGRLPTAAVLRAGIQIARALEAAHEKDVVHRDLKPSNVMLCRETVKVLDFGIAKSFASGASDLTRSDTSGGDLTETGALVGTAPYMSPEQIRGGAVDKRTDVWAFGCVMFEAFTGTGPFARETVADTLAAILEYEPRWELLPDDCPANVGKLLRRCLQKDLARRARDLWDVRLELEEALAEVAPQDPTAPERPGEPATAAEQPDVHQPETLQTAAEAPPPTEAPAPEASDPGTHERLSQGERRQTTILTSTVGAYGTMAEQLAVDESERALAEIHRIVKAIVATHGGIVNRFARGELLVLFGVPTAHEDDPLRAIRAALDIHRQVRAALADVEERLGEPIRMNTAIHSGPVVVRIATEGGEEFTIAGPTLQMADRLATEAAADEILISADCHRVAAPFFDTEPLPTITLRGTAEQVVPYRVIAEKERQSRFEAAAELDLTRYTGRDREMHMLRSSLEAAMTGNGQLLTLEGEVGVGKSRLLYEFSHGGDCDQAALVRGRCRSDGAGLPYLPFIEALKSVLEIPEDAPTIDAESVASRIIAINPALDDFIPLYLHLLSIESPDYELPQHLQGDDFRIAMLEALSAIFTLPANERPVVMLLEDWHWADEASREVLSQLTSMLAAFAMLVIVTYRPEGDFDWGRGSERRHLTLEPLSEEFSVEVIKSVLGVQGFPTDLARMIHERTGGNPFFLEEVCHALEEEGVVRIEDAQATLTGSLDAVYLPDTVQAVILTRLDRLDPEPREVVRLASVVGREFGRRILERTMEDTGQLLTVLGQLKELGIVQQIAVVPEAVYRFKHALTREVAYGSLLPHQLRGLHGRVGEAIESLYPDRVDEHAARLAHHFGAAEEWEKAIEYGRRAAHKASRLQRADEALPLLESVHLWLTKLPESTDRQARLADVLLEMERACETLGRRSRQEDLINELTRLLEPAGASVRLVKTRIRQGELNVLLGQFEAADKPLREAISMTTELGDRELERAARRGLGFLRWQEERYDEAIECNERALEISVELEDDDAQGRDRANLASVLRSAGEPEKAIEHMTQALELTDLEANHANHGYLLNILGKIYRDLGDDDSALAAIEQARQLCADERIHIGLCFNLSAMATIYMERGDTDRCHELYEEMAQVSRTINYAEGLSIATRRLGELLFSLRHDDEALLYFEENAALSAQLRDQESEATSWTRIGELHERNGRADDAVAAWAKVQQLREDTRDSGGEIEAHEGIARATRMQDSDAAISHYNTALTLAIGLDDKPKQGELLNSMAITQWRAGNFHEALEFYERALRVFEGLDDEVHQGLVLNSIAVALRDMERPADALKRAEDALEVNRRTGQEVLEGHSLAVLGDVHFAMDKLSEALDHYQASLDLRRQIGDRPGEGWMLYRLSQVCAAQDMADLATSYAHEATQIAEEIDDTELRAAVHGSAPTND